MKKNIMMRVASTLLIAVLLTTCAIAGTFAKYVTSETGSDSARVAKFGVKITANGQMFKETYQGIETGWTSASTVNSESGKVVAPGTSGEMVKMTLTGTPEVAVRVSYEATTFNLAGWKLSNGSTEYCPIVFTINGATYGMDYTAATNKSSTVADLEDAIKAAIAGYTKEYAPNQNLADVEAHSLAISWEWAFNVNDVNDTDLGDKAAAGNAATISITVKTTVTQID